MKTWVRAGQSTVCGGVAPSGKACPHIIAAGDPMLVIELPGIERRKYRCETCAGEAPPELPPHVEQSPRMKPMVHIATGPNTLPLDFKQAASGEREPGMEG